MKRMNVIKKFFLYRRIEKATTKELELQKQLNQLVEDIDKRFDQEGKHKLAESKDILRAASLKGQDVDWHWRELNKTVEELNTVRDKKKKLLFKLM